MNIHKSEGDEEGVVLNVIQSSQNQENLTIKSSLNHEEDANRSSNSNNQQQMSLSRVVMAGDEYIKEDSLLSCIEMNHPRTLRVLKLTGCYWPISEDTYGSFTPLMFKSYFLFARFGFLPLFMFCMLHIAFAIAGGNETAIGIILPLTIALDIVSVIPAQYINQIRLNQPARELDLSVLEEAAKIAEYLLGTYVLIVIVPMFATVLAINQDSYGASRDVFAVAVVIVTIGEFCIAAYLSFNLLILLMDLKVCSILMDQLQSAAVRQTLTMTAFVSAREDIHRRVQEARFATDVIIAPCLATALSMVVLMFHDDYSGLGSGAYYSTVWGTALSKEVLFVSIAFWFVAQVNGKADALTSQVSAMHWTSQYQQQHQQQQQRGIAENGHIVSLSSSTGRKVSGSTSSDNNDDNENTRGTGLRTGATNGTGVGSSVPTGSTIPTAGIITEVNFERISVACGCLADPISITLLSKRVTWNDVALGAFGFGISLMFGIISAFSGFQQKTS